LIFEKFIMNTFNKILTAALIAGSGIAIAADSASVTPDASITDLLRARLGGAPVGAVKETPVKGVYQTTMGAKVAYLSGDGRYVLVGDMIDLQTQRNLTEESRRVVAKGALENFAQADLIIYPAEGPTRTALNVFTDTSCPYCKKLHEEVPELQKAGIEVRYFPFARGGSRGPGYDTLRRVWCGDDRLKTMNIAKGVEDGNLPDADCKNASIVDRAYELGNDIGVEGTPALFTSEGQKISGYVPYQKLIPMLLNGG
jgi:thiol:disulfide interchange protein DsbC